MVANTSKDRIAGLILAAGYGTRMRPLTEYLPKSLLPILGVPLLEIVARKLRRAGASRIHVNAFHLAEKLEEFAAGSDPPLVLHREETLLGTGGGIGNMAGSLEGTGTIILHLGDILSNIDFTGAVSFHESRGTLVTLVLVPAGPVANVECSIEGDILHIGDVQGETERGTRFLGYTGMAVMSPGALAYFPQGEAGGFVDALHRMIEERPGSVAGFDVTGDLRSYRWETIGSPDNYIEIHRAILLGGARFDMLLEPPPLPLHVGEGARVADDTIWKGFLEVGRHATIGTECNLESCVVLEGTDVPAGSSFRNAILYPEGIIEAKGKNSTEIR
jgi:mannose-1-phosphate guanylyltransferase